MWQFKWAVRHGWRILKNMAIIFSSSPFAIRLNLLHPQPSLFLFGLLLPLWCFSTLESYSVFWGFLQFEGDFFALRKKYLKYRDKAPESCSVCISGRNTVEVSKESPPMGGDRYQRTVDFISWMARPVFVLGKLKQSYARKLIQNMVAFFAAELARERNCSPPRRWVRWSIPRQSKEYSRDGYYLRK